ncbi:hypothetical protein RI543_005191 [Arxiozyma heterogenica]|uniref:Uncharacterized protein n=1 Tax=Arxiozyma heterogenica TaxID=278026 RepID=A0AAN7WI22_9SACH|nr:hypothetical protein RI543_005191 [Kazachstania heterogenica]
MSEIHRRILTRPQHYVQTIEESMLNTIDGVSRNGERNSTASADDPQTIVDFLEKPS